MILLVLLPVPTNITLDRSTFCSYQTPFPFYPMIPKSWAHPITKKALYFFANFWMLDKLGEAESTENNPSVMTIIALVVSFERILSSIWAMWPSSKCLVFVMFLVTAFAPSKKELSANSSITIWSYYLMRDLGVP